MKRVELAFAIYHALAQDNPHACFYGGEPEKMPDGTYDGLDTVGIDGEIDLLKLADALQGWIL